VTPRDTRASNPGTHGFTLLELLVALVVFGLLMAGLAQGLRFGLGAWSTQSRVIARDADLDAVERVLRALLGGLDPGRKIDPPNIVGTNAGLAFTAELPRGAPPGRASGGASGGASDGPAIGDSGRHADMLLHVDAAHRLVLEWLPHLHVRRLGPPPAPVETELLPGIARLELAYWTRDGGWRDAWRDRVPPDLIRVRLIFVAGDARRWPDIVIAPMRRPADA
jgi:general secretion pathway protein J